MKTKLLFSIAILLSGINSFGQNHRTCGTMDNLEDMIKKDPSMIENMQKQEEFTQQWIKEHQIKRTNDPAAVITIPVVVHVIHFGEALGTGGNISDAQINSQIIALNEDFRLHNDDSLMPTHPFWPYTSDSQIEFCLAQRDPSGSATTGILRYTGGQSSWDRNSIETIVKPQTIWDRNKYLNLWVLTFGGTEASLLGYAQFPGGAANTDGVVIRYNSFGYVGNVDPPYDNGRTGVHEVGHWLNLRHIWGDATCGDDFVSDTRVAVTANYNCPSFPHNANNSCGTDANGEMYMNYMDYVDDNCMVMYTFGQASRMQATLNGARSSLKTSNGCVPPVGISELLLLNSVDIYPNPSNGIFIINSQNLNAEETSLEVYNLIGEKIKSLDQINSFPYEINLSGITNGLYYLKVTNKNNYLIKKIIISNSNY